MVSSYKEDKIFDGQSPYEHMGGENTVETKTVCLPTLKEAT